MSAPPGYNPGESMLQGGTTQITPVMGGGRIKMALKQKRKHVTKKRGKKPGTRRQRGGLNHYALTSIDEYSKNRAHAVTNITIDEPKISDDIVASTPRDINDFKQYIYSSSKFWKRKLKTQFAPVNQQKAVTPNKDNIGCSATMIKAAVRTITRFAPDRVCVFLPRDTESITVLPPVNGDLNLFLRIMKSIVDSISNNNVYIFSPPFFGFNEQANFELFTQYVNYKMKNFKEIYLLIENNTNTIEAMKVLSSKTKGAMGNTSDLAESLTTDSAKDPTLPDKTIIDALYPMLEPSYIIYPYTVNFGQDVETSLPPKGGITLDEWNEKFQEITAKLVPAKEAVTEAQRRYTEAQTEHQKAAAKAFTTRTQTTETTSRLATLRQEVEELTRSISGTQAVANTAVGPVQLDLQANITLKSEELQKKKEAVQRAESAASTATEDYKTLSATADRLGKAAEAAKRAMEGATAKLAAADKLLETEKKALGEKPEDSPAGSTEERGGLLFSAATTKEATLPAPVAGFNGAINYIQLSDQLKSIAYKIDATKNDPLLESVDYKEYSLFKAPPMKKDHLYKMTLKKQRPETPIEVDVNQEMFKASPNAVQNHVPDVSISVGAQDFSIRSPVPDTVNDWKNGIYSNDEANYLEAMSLTPKILITVYGDKWKEQLTNHLIIISRSKCFKDSRLLLHSDCQDAQRFVSDIMNYYMTHSSELIALQKGQREAQAAKLSKQLKALTVGSEVRCTPESNIFYRSNFTEAFFLPKDADPKKFLRSVGPVKIDTSATEFTVSYTGKIFKDDIQGICNQLPEMPTLTIAYNEAGFYTWTFGSEQSRYMVKFISRKYLPDLKILDMNYVAKPTDTITLVYTGKLSSEDENILKTVIDYETIEDGLLNMHTAKLKTAKTMDTEAIKAQQTKINAVNNINNFNITFTPIDINQIDGMDGNIGMKFGDSTLTLQAIMADRCNKETLKAGELSMNYKIGVSIEEATDILEMVYADIYDKINDEGSKVFSGRYQFYTQPRSKLTKNSPPIATDV